MCHPVDNRTISVRLMVLAPCMYNRTRRRGEIRGSKPDGGTESEGASWEREIVVGGRNGDKVKATYFKLQGDHAACS